jgi:hypothetical protein
MHMLVWTAGHGNLLRRLANCPHFTEVPAVATTAPPVQRPVISTADVGRTPAEPPPTPTPLPPAHLSPNDHLDHKHSQPGPAAVNNGGQPLASALPSTTISASADKKSTDLDRSSETRRKTTLAIEFEQLIDQTTTAELAIEQRALAQAHRCDGTGCHGKLQFTQKKSLELRCVCAPISFL